MNQEQASNLLNVATALRSAEREKLPFNMARYGNALREGWSRFMGKQDGSLSVRDRDVHTCGTPACALGHYACRFDLQSW